MGKLHVHTEKYKENEKLQLAHQWVNFTNILRILKKPHAVWIHLYIKVQK